jgi:hypothetical protein
MGDRPAFEAEHTAAIRMHCPGWTLVDHDDDAELGEWADWFAPLALERDMPRHRANVIRYRLLFEQGGIWLDHDVRVLASLEPLRRGPRVAAVGTQPEGSMMAMPAYHPFLWDLLVRVGGMVGQVDAGTAPQRSGGRLLRDVWPGHCGTVSLDRSTIPYDAAGRSNFVGVPLAEHRWSTTPG